MSDVFHKIETIITRKDNKLLTMQDISNWQAGIDVSSLPDQVLAIKATEGTGYISPAFSAQWAAAKKAGKVRMAYHYNHPSLSPLAQVRAFLNVVKENGLEAGDLLAIDNEVNDGLSPQATAENVLAFVQAVNADTKASTVVYTFLNFAETGHCAGLGGSPLWIADPSSPKGQPRVPAPWNLWSFHQYGFVRGIDADVANFESVAQLEKLAVLPAPPPLQPGQLVIELTDGTTSKNSVVMEQNLVPGFTFTAGDATFKVTERGA